MLETLVKLASLGTSGICIFAIFWIGWLIWKSEASKDVEKQRTLRFFMVVCFLISLVSAATGWWSGRMNEKKIAFLRNQVQKYELLTRSYRVKGTVLKEDGSDPGDIVIATHFPARVPGPKGSIVELTVQRDHDGNLPSLSFNCPGYSQEGVNLNDEKVTDNVIELSKAVVLPKLPDQ